MAARCGGRRSEDSPRRLRSMPRWTCEKHGPQKHRLDCVFCARRYRCVEACPSAHLFFADKVLGILDYCTSSAELQGYDSAPAHLGNPRKNRARHSSGKGTLDTLSQQRRLTHAPLNFRRREACEPRGDADAGPRVALVLRTTAHLGASSSM